MLVVCFLYPQNCTFSRIGIPTRRIRTTTASFEVVRLLWLAVTVRISFRPCYAERRKDRKKYIQHGPRGVQWPDQSNGLI
jgi:hypothetical protein